MQGGMWLGREQGAAGPRRELHVEQLPVTNFSVLCSPPLHLNFYNTEARTYIPKGGLLQHC